MSKSTLNFQTINILLTISLLHANIFTNEPSYSEYATVLNRFYINQQLPLSLKELLRKMSLTNSSIKMKKGKNTNGLDFYFSSWKYKTNIQLYSKGNELKMVRWNSVFRAEELSVLSETVPIENIIQWTINEKAKDWYKAITAEILTLPNKSIEKSLKNENTIIKLGYNQKFRSLTVTISAL